jgi:hypothetical protein
MFTPLLLVFQAILGHPANARNWQKCQFRLAAPAQANETTVRP